MIASRNKYTKFIPIQTNDESPNEKEAPTKKEAQQQIKQREGQS